MITQPEKHQLQTLAELHASIVSLEEHLTDARRDRIREENQLRSLLGREGPQAIQLEDGCVVIIANQCGEIIYTVAKTL